MKTIKTAGFLNREKQPQPYKSPHELPFWAKALLAGGIMIASGKMFLSDYTHNLSQYGTEIKNVAESQMPPEEKKKAVDQINEKHGYGPNAQPSGSGNQEDLPASINPTRMMDPVDRMTNPANPFYGN